MALHESKLISITGDNYIKSDINGQFSYQVPRDEQGGFYQLIYGGITSQSGGAEIQVSTGYGLFFEIVDTLSIPTFSSDSDFAIKSTTLFLGTRSSGGLNNNDEVRAVVSPSGNLDNTFFVLQKIN